MRERSLLGTLATKKGESSLLIIILMAGLIVLILLPMFAIIFDKGLARLAAQDITDQIDLNTYLVYQTIDFKALSHQSLNEKGQLKHLINGNLDFSHPQVKQAKVSDVVINNTSLLLTINIQLIPTLYRHVYDLDKVYTYYYHVTLPLDGVN